MTQDWILNLCKNSFQTQNKFDCWLSRIHLWFIYNESCWKTWIDDMVKFVNYIQLHSLQSLCNLSLVWTRSDNELGRQPKIPKWNFQITRIFQKHVISKKNIGAFELNCDSIEVGVTAPRGFPVSLLTLRLGFHNFAAVSPVQNWIEVFL